MTTEGRAYHGAENESGRTADAGRLMLIGQLLHGLEEGGKVFVILALELQPLEIGEATDRRFQAKGRVAGLDRVVQCAECGGNHGVPLADFFHKGLNFVLPIVPRIDPLFGPRIVRVVRPAILALIVHINFHAQQLADPVEKMNDAQVTPDEVRNTVFAGILSFAEIGIVPAVAEAGLDLPLLLELFVFRPSPSVVAVLHKPPFPPLPIELPTGRVLLRDRPDETVIVLGAVGHLDFRRVTGKAEECPLAARAGDGPERYNVQRLHRDARRLLAVPRYIDVFALSVKVREK